LLEAVAWPKRHSSRKTPPFAPFCQRQLTPLAAEFFRLAEADLRDHETMHSLRIAGKRLRYALELAPAAMPASAFQQFYEALDQIQDQLGQVVDQIAAIAQLRDSLDLLDKKSHRHRLQRLLSREEERLARLRAKVLREWSPARRKYLHKLWQKARSPAS
jgi:CHAD domain-containing protein